MAAHRITTEAGKRSGQPCIRGLRVTVGNVPGSLASGKSGAETLTRRPELEKEGFKPPSGGSGPAGVAVCVVSVPFDGNLSRKLLEPVADLFAGSAPVCVLEIQRAANPESRHLARANGFMKVRTKLISR
ncbi:MAG: DUF433 domain-containing protein [Acidobacteriota bacterium]